MANYAWKSATSNGMYRPINYSLKRAEIIASGRQWNEFDSSHALWSRRPHIIKSHSVATAVKFQAPHPPFGHFPYAPLRPQHSLSLWLKCLGLFHQNEKNRGQRATGHGQSQPKLPKSYAITFLNVFFQSSFFCTVFFGPTAATSIT